jgi:hypothetical protein
MCCLLPAACCCLLLQGYLYVRACKEDNEYAHPLDL